MMESENMITKYILQVLLESTPTDQHKRERDFPGRTRARKREHDTRKRENKKN